MPKHAGRAARPAGLVPNPWGAACLAVLTWLCFSDSSDAASDYNPSNPVLNDPAAIEQGRSLYRRRCVVCHGHSGGRGPNLFATELSDAEFLKVVTSGRKGTVMPAFGARMSPDEIWTVHAFVKSTDSYR